MSDKVMITPEQKMAIIRNYLRGAQGHPKLTKVMSRMFQQQELQGSECPSCKATPLTRFWLFPGTVWSGYVECGECSWRLGYMSYLGRELFPIQEMPQGSPFPLYDEKK